MELFGRPALHAVQRSFAGLHGSGETPDTIDRGPDGPLSLWLSRQDRLTGIKNCGDTVATHSQCRKIGCFHSCF
ncbi:hypothetical protein KL86PLE_10175 [uncultured Pleomorphomonas sp.]|uniref:Uncharacterized protein n=1 Tax=uncultured Pleomorphomonas sp. TaxID=442121 RepID=A0A212KYW4_9HYPH|nr:hypothetical protein KL86PLE_10175 [uncultured Pleomorphomonas sp.]